MDPQRLTTWAGVLAIVAAGLGGAYGVYRWQEARPSTRNFSQALAQRLQMRGVIQLAIQKAGFQFALALLRRGIRLVKTLIMGSTDRK